MIIKNLNNKNDLSLENILNSNAYEDEDLEDTKQIINEIGFSYESLSLALGNYEVNYKAIDEFFDLHEEKLIKHMINMAGTKNDVDKIGSIERLPIEKITATRKIYIIITNLYQLSDVQDDGDEVETIFFIEKLIKKSFNSTYRFYKNNNVLDYEEYIRYIAKRTSDKDNLYNHIILIWLYRTGFYDEKCEKELGITLQAAEFLYVRCMSNLQSEIIKDRDYNQVISDNSKYYYETFVKKRKISEVFSALKDKVIDELDVNNIKIDEMIRKCNEAMCDSELTRTLGLIVGWMKAHGVEADLLIKDTPQDMEKLEILIKYLDKDIKSQSELKLLFPIFALVDKFIDEHKKTKKQYLENDSLKVKKEIWENNLKHEELILSKDKEIERLKKELATLNSDKKALEKEHKKLTKEFKGLQISLSEKEEDIKSLEKIVFTKETQINNSINNINSERYKEKEIEITSEILEELKNKKGVIIGGDYSLHNKLKEILCEFYFVAPEDINQFDLKSLKQLDTIHIYTDYLSHALYKKVIPYARKNNKKVIYLVGANVNMIIKKILD